MTFWLARDSNGLWLSKVKPVFRVGRLDFYNETCVVSKTVSLIEAGDRKLSKALRIKLKLGECGKFKMEEIR